MPIRKASARVVYNDNAPSGVVLETTGGLRRKDLMKNDKGKIVSKKQHKRGRSVFKNNGLKLWNQAVREAGYMKKGDNRKIPRKDTPGHKKITKIYKRLKAEAEAN